MIEYKRGYWAYEGDGYKLVAFDSPMQVVATIMPHSQEGWEVKHYFSPLQCSDTRWFKTLEAAQSEAELGAKVSTSQVLPILTLGSKDNEPTVTITNTPPAGTTAALICQVCDDLKAMLLENNRKYGDSALNPVRIFSKADRKEQLRVRIDDKLSRLARGVGDDEDTEKDLMGYLVLLKVAKLQGATHEQS